jgi:hypothetical protein
VGCTAALYDILENGHKARQNTIGSSVLAGISWDKVVSRGVRGPQFVWLLETLQDGPSWVKPKVSKCMIREMVIALARGTFNYHYAGALLTFDGQFLHGNQWQ